MKTLVQTVMKHSNQSSTKPALIYKSGMLTYSKLADAIVCYASILQNEYSVCSHDRILISAVSKPDYIVAFLAVQFLGALYRSWSWEYKSWIPSASY